MAKAGRISVSASSYTHRPRSSYVIDRNIRTHGEKLARRRDTIADMWSGRHDGRCWTAQEIANELDIQIKGVFGHLKALRIEGDARAYRPAHIGTKRAHNPIRVVEEMKDAAE